MLLLLLLADEHLLLLLRLLVRGSLLRGAHTDLLILATSHRLSHRSVLLLQVLLLLLRLHGGGCLDVLTAALVLLHCCACLRVSRRSIVVPGRRRGCLLLLLLRDVLLGHLGIVGTVCFGHCGGITLVFEFLRSAIVGSRLWCRARGIGRCMVLLLSWHSFRRQEYLARWSELWRACRVLRGLSLARLGWLRCARGWSGRLAHWLRLLLLMLGSLCLLALCQGSCVASVGCRIAMGLALGRVTCLCLRWQMDTCSVGDLLAGRWRVRLAGRHSLSLLHLSTGVGSHGFLLLPRVLKRLRL